MLRKHTCGRNEFDLLLHTYGWTKALLMRALAFTKAERQRLLALVTPEGLRAVQYLVEHGLVQWVAHQNLTKRIAPTAAVAAQELATPPRRRSAW